MWGFQNRVCLSVCLSICPYPEKRNHHSFVNISPTLVIDTSMERSSQVLHNAKPKIRLFFQKSSKFKFWLVLKSWNNLSFVNISPTLVIDTSMERSSRVLQHGNPKIWFFFQKSSKFKFWLVLKSWNNLSFVNISPILVIDTSMERSSRVLQLGNPKIWIFFSKKFEIRILLLTKSWNHLSFVNISPTLVIDTSMERSSRVLQLGNPKIWIFFSKKFEIRILLLTKSWNHLSFVNISPTLAIDTSMERSSRILQHGIIIIWLKKIRNWVLTCFFFLSSNLKFDLCRRAEIIRVDSTCTYMTTSAMHRRPFEGRHLVADYKYQIINQANIS